MHTVTSFRASDVESHQVSAIMAEYLALERARTYRRLFVTRFGLLALVVAVVGFGLHWLSAFASWSSVGLCVVAPTWAWLAELRNNRRLARSLEEIPSGQIVVPRRKKVVKSS
jgi:anti-sigma factor RsiW